MLDTVTPLSFTRVSRLSGGFRWCLLVLIVESPIQVTELTSYLVLCVQLLTFSLPHVSYGVYKSGLGVLVAIRRW